MLYNTEYVHLGVYHCSSGMSEYVIEWMVEITVFT